MKNSAQHRSGTFKLNSQPVTGWLAIAIVFALVTVLAQSAQAQTYAVLHEFSGYAGGSEPTAGLTMAGPGNFYGTTTYGGSQDAGTVFNLRRAGSGWILTFLYSFQGGYSD